jgi:hypothetical protein
LCSSEFYSPNTSSRGYTDKTKGSEIAGVSRHEFLEALNRYNVSPFQVTPEELAEELGRD